MVKKNKAKTKIKYAILAIITVILLYHSVYFRKLDEIRKEAEQQAFDARAYVVEFWEEKLPNKLHDATDAKRLLSLLKTDMKKAIERYARTLGLAKNHFYLVKGEGTVLSIEDDGVLISLSNTPKNADIIIATNYIFGNAIRDASGLIDVSDFPNSRDFNSISAEINKMVINRVVPPFMEKVNKGMKIKFVGAAEVREDDPDLDPLNIIPIQLKFK